MLAGPPTADRTATSAEWLRPEFTAGQTTPPLSAQHLFPMVDSEMFKRKEKGKKEVVIHKHMSPDKPRIIQKPFASVFVFQRRKLWIEGAYRIFLGLLSVITNLPSISINRWRSLLFSPVLFLRVLLPVSSSTVSGCWHTSDYLFRRLHVRTPPT